MFREKQKIQITWAVHGAGGEIILVLRVNQKTPFERCRFVAKNVHFPNTANYSAVNTRNPPSMIHDPAVPEGHQLGFILH